MKNGKLDDFMSPKEVGRLLQRFFNPLGVSVAVWNESMEVVFSDFSLPEFLNKCVKEWFARAQRVKEPFIANLSKGSCCVIPLLYDNGENALFLGLSTGYSGASTGESNSLHILFQANLFCSAFRRRLTIKRMPRFRTDYFLILSRIEELTAGHAIKRYPHHKNVGLKLIFDAFNDLADSINFQNTMAVPGRIRYYAFKDPLTDTYNRHFLNEQLKILKEKRDMFPIGVLFLDVDNLKAINDELGHAEGDRNIAAFVDALKASLRASDKIFRIGGDEFVVLIPLATPESMEKIVNRINTNLNYVNRVEGMNPPISASAGYAMWHSPSEPFSKVLEVADKAMYSKKKNKHMLE